MSDLSRLEEGLLELGLEDLIPLPEILGTQEARDASGRDSTVEQISSALVVLLRRGLIGVWVGHWADEPRRAEPDDAEGILADPRRYFYSTEADGTERAYFVNKENVA